MTVFHLSSVCHGAGLFPSPPGPDDDTTVWELSVNTHQPCDGYAGGGAWCDCPCHLDDLNGVL